MTTKQQILDDFIIAFKAKDELRKIVLADIKAEILVQEKSKSGTEVDNDALLAILKTMAKRRKDSVESFKTGNREDLASKEEAELKVIEEYLPQQLSAEAVKEVAIKVIADGGFGATDFGKAMGAVMAELKGQSDGTVVSGVLKELLK